MKTGAGHNARADRRLFHELAHAACVRHWTSGTARPARHELQHTGLNVQPVSSTVVSGGNSSKKSTRKSKDKDKGDVTLSPPRHWPFIWAESLSLAGPVLEALVGAVAAAVPRPRRLSVVARRVQLGQRLRLLTAAELQALHGSAEGEGKDGAALLASAFDSLAEELGSLALVGELRVSPCVVSTRCEPGGSLLISIEDGEEHEQEQEQEESDAAVCGAARLRAPTLRHWVSVAWPAAAAWRRDLGLSTEPEGGFVVELGI